MKCLLLIAVLIGITAGQHRSVDPRNAAILQEARYLSGDGSFGSAYVQEDGVEFKEETDNAGTRKGQYSYFDPNGKKITVQYTAGKDGFQVSGDHLPKSPAPLPVGPSQYQPQQNYYNQPQNYQSSAPTYHHSGAPTQSIPDTPEVAAAKAEHFRAVEEARRTNAALEQQERYNQPDQYNPAPNYNTNPQYNTVQTSPQQYSFNNFQNPASSSFGFNRFQTTTTPAPHRFFPPGKLNLNRTPDGYQYSFSSN